MFLNLEDSRVKQWMLVITYAVILVLVVINFLVISHKGYLDVRRLSETIVCRHRDCVCAEQAI